MQSLNIRLSTNEWNENSFGIAYCIKLKQADPSGKTRLNTGNRRKTT